ncbi:TrmH family RNA methyltransferase [Fusibacter tunisiensis]|jgi:TrmH family RNA methyltransferase|uniref:TrmH family RNA methyltransferase n=1 Tax=Fusibacter tunisiensis TaxID=1008308 RepID=A0ABS2MRP0_9FIRM|nr:TrmH family RNA methyltransferase [Fusibacter tunisiensis]MBM7562045.1 TrmH family RNA methyltransferase [Fusibacter tunisiensis]
MFIKMEIEGKEQFLKDTYPLKIRYAGAKSPYVKQVDQINNNKKGNPRQLIPVEGIWANQFVTDYSLTVEYLLLSVEEIVTPEAYQMMIALIEMAPQVYLISKKTMQQISESGNPAGMISVCEFPKRSLNQLALGPNSLIVVMDGLEIPGNVGTITRSADGTDVDAIIITNRKTRLTHPKFIRSSQGSCFKVPIVEATYDDVSEWLMKRNYQIVLTDTDGAAPYYEPEYSGNVAIVMGSERHGISREWYNQPYQAVKIPMFGDCDSLNVGIAATVILYEATLKRKGFLKRR